MFVSNHLLLKLALARNVSPKTAPVDLFTLRVELLLHIHDLIPRVQGLKERAGIKGVSEHYTSQAGFRCCQYNCRVADNESFRTS